MKSASIKSTSIKDIALKANVSITTVSFILNGKAEKMRIRKEVIDRVKAIIIEDEFRPNQVARSLRTGTTKTIGLIVEDISNSFFASIARKIEDKAYKKGYKISYSSTENNLAKAKELIEMFKSRQVDAYIIAPVPGTEDDIRQLLAENIPVVIFDRNLPDLDVNYVVVDNYQGTYQATEYLLNEGRKNIAFVTVDLHVDQMNNRFYGYKQALEDNGITFNKQIYIEIPFDDSEENTTARLMLLFQDNPEIDAVIFSTNYLAIKGLGVFKLIDKKINQDFCMISYDDHDVFRLHTPPISVVDQPMEEIAEQIIDILLRELAMTGEADLLKRKVSKVTLPAKLIIR